MLTALHENVDLLVIMHTDRHHEVVSRIVVMQEVLDDGSLVFLDWLAIARADGAQ